MNYVDSYNLFGIETKQIPCIPGTGAPSTSTAGAVGMLYMDTDTGDIYKCTAVVNGVYTWAGFGSAITEDVNPGDTLSIRNVHSLILHGKSSIGKNLCSLGSAEFTGFKDFDIAEIPAGTYVVSANIESSANVDRFYFALLKKGEDGYSGSGYLYLSKEQVPWDVIKPADVLRLYAADTYGNSSGQSAKYTEIQIEKGSVKTDYEEYGLAGVNAEIMVGNYVFTADTTLQTNEQIDFATGEVLREDGTVENFSVSGNVDKLNGSYTITAPNTVTVTHEANNQVLYTPQALSKTQQARARENIGVEDKKKADFLNSINIEYGREHNASYVFVRIPYSTNDGVNVRPKVRLTSVDGSLTGTKYSTLDYANRENTVFALNAGLFDVSTLQPLGQTIIDGVSIVNEPHPQGANNETISDTECYPLCVDADGILSAPYANTVDTATMITDGIVQACCGWVKLVENYVITEADIASEIVHTGAYVKQAIGQFENGDYCVCSVAKRGYGSVAPNDNGMTYTQVAQLFVDRGAKFAYALDGGGSAQTVIGKRHLNPIYEGTTGRKIPAIIVFEIEE